MQDFLEQNSTESGDKLKADNKKYRVDCWVNNNIFITSYQNEGTIKSPIFILYDSSEPLDLSDNTEIFYRVTNKNREVLSVPVNILSAVKGEIEIPILPVLTSEIGNSMGEIVVKSGSGSLLFGGINIKNYASPKVSV